MASGDSLFILHPAGSIPPSANFATLDAISDASTPNLIIPVLDFDGATDEHMDWIREMPSQYAGGGLTFRFKYAMSSTDGNIVEIEFRVLVIADQTVLTGDLGLDTQTAVAIQDDPDATANDFNYSTTGNLSHANAGSPSVADFLAIRATRDISAATNSDDLQLAAIYVSET